MRHLKIAIVSGVAALLLPMADGQAQQDTRSRLMFDPAGVQGSPSRTAAPLQPSPTTGQSTTSRQTVQAPSSAAARAPAAPQQSAAPAAKPAATPKPAVRTGIPARTASPRQPARTDNNAGNGGATASARPSDRPVPREQPASLGRIDLPSGSLGFENRTALRDYEMTDGRKVPGFDNIQRNESSYFGLSIRMPTPSSSPSWLRQHSVD